MARPIWNGMLSFGLVNIPIRLMPGEKRSDIHFRLMDARNRKPIRYERVNATTGKEVPWNQVVKAYEYSKGNYVVLEPGDIAAAATDNKETIELDAFVDAGEISPAYHEKPYVLVPGKRAEKGYVLLRETLRKSGKAGLGRVVIRTREYLAMVLPEGDALVLILLRYPAEVVDVDEYALPAGGLAKWKVTPREMQMANTLLESLAVKFDPKKYKDQFQARLSAAIKKRLKSKGTTTHVEESGEGAPQATTNVVDLMALLRESLDKKARPVASSKRTATRRRSRGGARSVRRKRA